MGRLIVACNDDARAQTAAALVVGGARGAHLRATAARRASFAGELSEIVRSFGGEIHDGGSSFETLRAAIHRVNALVIGENPGDAYSSCARIEAHTEKLYERRMHVTMPAAMHELIARQHGEIATDRAALRRASMGGE